MTILEAKGPGEVASEILMMRSARRSSFLIVEGVTDSKFFAPRTDPAECEIVIGGGKKAVVGGVALLEQKKVDGTLGIVDDDCDSIDFVPTLPKNIVAIDEARDLDALLFWSGAFESVLAEFVDPLRLARSGGPQAVRTMIVRIASVFGDLRRCAAIHSWSVDFSKTFGPRRYVSPALQFDEARLFQDLEVKLSLAEKDIRDQVALLAPGPPSRTCQGHDLLTILSLALSRHGVLDWKSKSEHEIASLLRLAYQKESWLSSKLYYDVASWERASPPYRILCSA